MHFTTEHKQIADTVTRFVKEEINPHVDEWEKAEQFPAHEVFKKLGNLGLLGLKYPEEYGGAGLDFFLLHGHGRSAGYLHLRRRAHGHRRADRHVHAGAGPLWLG
jgi:citronellyl-CoA dehydrogenase